MKSSMNAESNPRLKRHFSVVAHSSDVVELRHGAWNPVSYTVSDDAASGTLLPVISRLDGRNSVAGIAGQTGVSKDEVDALIAHLDGLGVLEHAATNALDHYIDHVVPNLLPYARPQGSVAGAGVVVCGDETIAGEVVETLKDADAAIDVATADPVLESLLRSNGSDWLVDSLAFEQRAAAFAPWRERFVVHVARSVHPATLQVLNRLSIHQGFAWLHATIDGPFLLVGPTFVPLRSACFECLEARVLMNLRESASYQRYKLAIAEGRVADAPDRLEPVLAKMLASHTAFEAMNFLLTGASFTVNKMLAIYLPTFEFTFNEVLRLPGCPACGAAPERDDRELYFELRSVLNGHNGHH